MGKRLGRQRENSKHLLPAQRLVGFSGEVFCRRLKPLRRSRSDKIREAVLEQNYQDKCNNLARCVKNHGHLLDLMSQMTCCNGEEFCGSTLCLELQERYKNNTSVIEYLLGQVGTNVDVLPSQIQVSLSEILHKDKKLRNKLEKVFWPGKQKGKLKGKGYNLNPGTGAFVSRKKTPLVDGFLQMFVYGIKEDMPLVLMVRQDEPGRILKEAIRKKCPTFPSFFTLLHRGRKISDERALKEQGLTQDCNIHVHFSLYGGMEKEKNAADQSGERNRKAPQKWKKAQVVKWIYNVCEQFEIEKEDVSKLTTLSGAGLMKLKRQDWLERCPAQGDLFFNLWTELLEQSAWERGSDATKSPPNSPRKGDAECAPKTVVDALPEKSGPSPKDSPRSMSPNDEQRQEVPIPSDSQKSDQASEGPFGTVENLGKHDDFLTVDELSLRLPNDGEVISVKGICSSRPKNSGGAGTCLLRNDPVEGSAFIELKVDIRACPDSTTLTKHVISSILNVKLGEELFVKGEIQRVEKGLKSMKKGFQILPFKIVVYSNHHAAFRKDVKVKPSYLRQLSIPWPVEYGIFPAEGSTQEAIFEGDTLESTYGILFCPTDVPVENIKEYVVALKNSLGGDIFIGVNSDGTVVGSRVSRDTIVQKRDNLARVLSGILPSVNEGTCFCKSAEEAHEFVQKEKNFVAAMYLQGKDPSFADVFEDTDKISVLFRIHVAKGTSILSYVKPEHTHAYIREGTETKLMTCDDLFGRLESLASRNIPIKTPRDVNKEVDKASTYEATEESYNLFKRVRFETEKIEFKVIFGDPTKIILKDYVKKYSASFINTDGGDILFGVEEDRQTRSGYVVGIVMPKNDREEVLRGSSEIICNFWPPVESSQFFMKFVEVKCDVRKNLLRYPKTHVEKEEQFIKINFQSNSNVQKFVNFAKSKIGQFSSVLRLENNGFGLLMKDASKVNVENFISELENERKNSKYFQIHVSSLKEIEAIVKDLCVVHLHVRASPYPIHLTSPFRTFCLDQQGVVIEMKPTQLLDRFAKRHYQYDPSKLLNAANRFEKENTSYVLICSPFFFPKHERYLYGLVVPEWALVLDFDQTPKQEGHLFNVFKPLHDLHQVERNLFVKTPRDRRLDVNPRNGVCWCAVRGYEDIDTTLSKEGHASWLMTHGHKMRTLIEQLIVHINPNQLVVVCLWDDGQEKLLQSVDTLLQHLFSCWPPTKAIFVCSNTSAKAAVLSLLVEPLERAGFGVKRDNIFVALPFEMARHVGNELPPPYRSEDAFQIPKKTYFPDGDRTIPDTLPQTIRQAIQGHLKIMYQNTGAAFKSKPEDEDKVRVKFYSGSEIDETGLASGIAIEREKMKEVKKEVKSLLNDKRSNVCFTILKAERGAGATTLCLQLLYEFHKQYVCARLLEFHESLPTSIEKINRYTRLPVILFVDSEMAYLPEFNDFKNEAERRNLNLKLLVVESDLLYIQQSPSKKKQTIPYFVGTAAFKTVELSRELTSEEAVQLVDHFLKIKDISEEKKAKLTGLKEKVSRERSLRKFAIVSLTAFGRKFTGLKNYVAYRLAQVTDELQLQILEFLALTHVYTDFWFPVNAFARMAKREVVLLEIIFNNDDVRELLSPPSSAGKNTRRMSFVEVAEEVLKQQAQKREMVHTIYLKDVALRLARCALSDPRPSKRIDRITRRLYVTSEYGDEKFSPFVRSMREIDPDVARDMLHDLSEIFERGSSVWAHLLAHLAKYYMAVYENFAKAIPLIQEAVKENKDDVLLHHIHGDITRLHVQNLKDQVNFSLNEILRYAIQGSQCFVTVKEKRPLMEHGYSSDALIRKIVMLAAIKSVGGSYFVDFLKTFLNRLKANEKMTSCLTLEDKYILSLVTEFFANVQVVPINEFSANLKDEVLENLGKLDDLKDVCEDLKETMKGTSDEDWVDVVVLQTMSLVYSLEIEKKQLEPLEADERIKSLEELLYKTGFDEEPMKMWIRYVRLGSTVPKLKAVRKHIDRWLKKTSRKSPSALFYNYVVAILEALNDPNDTEKMKTANECVRELQHKRRLPRSKGISQDPSLPIEWLHPKEGRQINSLDTLLYHEDLVRDYLKGATPRHPNRSGKEIIEKALFQKSITKWEGVVSEISSDWKGTISLKKRINVSFVPVNAQPFMPNEGDEVRFCLAFHWTGPTAWGVFCQAGLAKSHKAAARSTVTFRTHPGEDDSDSETSDRGDEEDLSPLVGPSLHTKTVRPRQEVLADNDDSYKWSHKLDQEMQGIILKRFSESGYGKIFHPKFQESLFFHAKQIVPPIDSLDSIELYTVVSFTVGKTERGPRAMNIKTVEEKNVDAILVEYQNELRKEHSAKTVSTSEARRSRKGRTVELPKTLQDLYDMRSRPEGHICELRGPPNSKKVHGFIEIPTIKEKVFFHELVSGIPKRELINYHLEAKVQFSVDKRERGFYAKDLYVKPPETKQVQCHCGWEDAVGKGIQEGFVGVLKRRFGFITKEYPREPNPKGIYFHELDLKDYSIAQLNIGDRVHFVVNQNDKGCVAQQIDVLRGGFPPTTTSIDPAHIYGRAHQMFLGAHANLGQFSQLTFPPPVSPPNPLRGPTAPVSPPRGPPMRNSIPGACSSFHEEYDESWQYVSRGKR